MTPFDELQQGTLEGLGEDEALIREQENKMLDETRKKIEEAKLKASKNVISKQNRVIVQLSQDLEEAKNFRETYLGMAP